MSRTDARADQGQLECLLDLCNGMILTSVNLDCDDHEILGETFGVWNNFPIDSEEYTRQSKRDTDIKSRNEAYHEHSINHSLLIFFV